MTYSAQDFWVLDVGSRGYEVYQKGTTGSIRVSSIGHGPTLGLDRAKQEADNRQTALQSA